MASFPEAKYKALIAKRRAAGLFYEDEDIPGDEQEPAMLWQVALLREALAVSVCAQAVCCCFFAGLRRRGSTCLPAIK